MIRCNTVIITNEVIKHIGLALGCDFGEFTLSDYEQANNIVGL